MLWCHCVLEDRKAVTGVEKTKKRMIRNCFQEYKMKITSVRFLSAVVLMVALICAVASGIDRLMADTGERITPWMAPHFVDNVYFVTFYGFIVGYMYSDVPFMNRRELYKILREGRLSWCIEKIVSIILQAFTLVVLTIAASILVFVPMIKFDWEWGKIIYTMAFSDNIYEYALFSNLSNVILIKYTPIQAMLLCFFMVWLVSSLIGLLMFAISLYMNRIFAVSSAAILTGLNLSNVKFIVAEWLPYVIPFYWCRISIYEEPVFLDRYFPSVKFYMVLSSIIFLMLIIIILLRSKRIEYVWSKEE